MSPAFSTVSVISAPRPPEDPSAREGISKHTKEKATSRVIEGPPGINANVRYRAAPLPKPPVEVSVVVPV
jgi:hypothetical protein